MNKIVSIICFFLIMQTYTEMYAQEKKEKEWKTLDLDSVTVQGWRRNSGIKKIETGTTIWDMKLLDNMPKILGNADPIRYAQLLPSVQTNNEYDSGIHIEGCEAQHNVISIGGVPLYNVSHLMGFFSLFNASHYPTMTLRKTVMDSGSPNRLGGSIDMNLPDRVQQDVNGEFAVGLISSQGTIRLPLTKKSSLFLSLRTSYLNLLYSRWLNVDGTSIHYSFTDANATYLYKPSERNTFWIDAYYGYDDANANFKQFGGDVKMKWGNQMLAAHHQHNYSRGAKLKHTVYTSRAINDLGVDLAITSMKLPSSIMDIGYKLEYTGKHLHAGFETTYHHIQPQSPETDKSLSIVDNTQKSVNMHENSLYADYTIPIVGNYSVNAGVRGIMCPKDMEHYFRAPYLYADPSISFKYNDDSWQWSLNYNMRHQMLHQTGLSNVSFPTEFWISASEDMPPQYGHCFSALADVKLADGNWSLSAELYYKRLFNQVEYCGTIMDLIMKHYDLSSSLYHGRGYNYGFSVMVNKHRGRLTGWMSYSYGRAKRQFAEYGYVGWYPALHERPHEVDVVCSYELSKRLSLGVASVVASGTPFTVTEAVYAYNGNILTQKGEHNGKRLGAYIRLDLSLNYKLNTKCFKESGLNFSLYNAQIRRNDISYYVGTYKDRFMYKPVAFILPLLPSISYYAKF